MKFSGWICNSEIDHTEMHKIIEKFGAEKYFFDEGQQLYWFRKKIKN